MRAGDCRPQRSIRDRTNAVSTLTMLTSDVARSRFSAALPKSTIERSESPSVSVAASTKSRSTPATGSGSSPIDSGAPVDMDERL